MPLEWVAMLKKCSWLIAMICEKLSWTWAMNRHCKDSNFSKGYKWQSIVASETLKNIQNLHMRIDFHNRTINCSSSRTQILILQQLHDNRLVKCDNWLFQTKIWNCARLNMCYIWKSFRNAMIILEEFCSGLTQWLSMTQFACVQNNPKDLAHSMGHRKNTFPFPLLCWARVVGWPQGQQSHRWP